MLRLRSLLSAELWRYCVLGGGTKRCALPQSEEMKIQMKNKYFISSSGDRTQKQFSSVHFLNDRNTQFFFSSTSHYIHIVGYREPWIIVSERNVLIKTLPFRFFRQTLIAFGVEWRNSTPDLIITNM